MHPMLNDMGITNLVMSARRGEFTIPDELDEAYQDFETFMTTRPRQADVDARVGEVFRTFNRLGGAKSFIENHLQPAFETFMTGFRADVAHLGKYVTEISVPLAMLHEPEETRDAYVRFASAYPLYGNLRAAWKDMRKRDGHSNEPLGADSPLAEVRNLPDLVANWEACHNGRAQWPWGANVPHVKLAWLVNNGGQLWMPTAEEQSANWARYGAAQAA
jgi:hypothetical protein